MNDGVHLEGELGFHHAPVGVEPDACLDLSLVSLLLQRSLLHMFSLAALKTVATAQTAITDASADIFQVLKPINVRPEV